MRQFDDFVAIVVHEMTVYFLITARVCGKTGCDWRSCRHSPLGKNGFRSRQENRYIHPGKRVLPAFNNTDCRSELQAQIGLLLCTDLVNRRRSGKAKPA